MQRPVWWPSIGPTLANAPWAQEECVFCCSALGVYKCQPGHGGRQRFSSLLDPDFMSTCSENYGERLLKSWLWLCLFLLAVLPIWKLWPEVHLGPLHPLDTTDVSVTMNDHPALEQPVIWIQPINLAFNPSVLLARQTTFHSLTFDLFVSLHSKWFSCRFSSRSCFGPQPEELSHLLWLLLWPGWNLPVYFLS